VVGSVGFTLAMGFLFILIVLFVVVVGNFDSRVWCLDRKQSAAVTLTEGEEKLWISTLYMLEGFMSTFCRRIVLSLSIYGNPPSIYHS
jgi:hypothetical protein